MLGGFFLFLEHRKKERECTSVRVLGNDPNAHIPSQPLKIRKADRMKPPVPLLQGTGDDGIHKSSNVPADLTLKTPPRIN